MNLEHPKVKEFINACHETLTYDINRIYAVVGSDLYSMLDVDEGKKNWLSKSENYPCMYYEDIIVYIIKNDDFI